MTALVDGLRVWLALGADLSRNPSAWTWTDVTQWVYAADGVTVEIGYPEGSDDSSHTRITFQANNTDRRWSFTNPAGAWFGLIDIDTPCRVTFDPGTGVVQRGICYLGDLPLETVDGVKRIVQVEALGRMSRMDSADPLDSNAKRTVLFWGADAYWPAEDAAGVLRLASAVSGQRDANISNTTSTAEFAGSRPLPVWTATTMGGSAIAPYPRAQPEEWTFGFALSVSARPAATTQFFAVRMAEPAATFRYFVMEMNNATPARIFLRAYTAASVELLADPGFDFTDVSSPLFDHEPFGERIGVQLHVTQNGTGIDWALTFWNEGGFGQGSTGTLAGQTLGPLVAWSAGPSAGMAGWTLGHFATGRLIAAAIPDFAKAGIGDPACARFLFQGVTGGLDVLSGSSAGPTMGPIPTGNLLEVLRECVVLDGGLFWERPDGIFYLRHLGDQYDRAVVLTLDYRIHLRDLTPIAAVRDYVNRVTVAKSGGSSAGVTVDATGPPSPARRGVVKSKPVTVNSQYETDLRYYAQWLAALGTTQDYRHTVELQFHGAASSKLATWLTMNIGDRVQILNPPTELPPETIDGYLRGYTERIDRLEYSAILRLLPYRPYLSWKVEGTGNTGRAETPGSKLLAGITKTATSAIVGTYGESTAANATAAKWSTTSPPYDLALRMAERVTCTAVVNNPPTFVAAGAAAHADAVAVTPGFPAGIVDGDLVLCLAACRNTAIQPIITDGAWVQLLMFGTNDNVSMFATTYVTGMTALFVQLTGIVPAAGDTVSAQTCGFRFAQPVANAIAVRTGNAAAANIATPPLVVQRNGCVIIVAGWKQDDWTSVATLAGFTEIGEPSSTLGNDQGLVWDYQIQTTATDIAATSFVVTGGTNQISKAGTVAILGDVQTLTLTRNVNAITGGGVAHPAAGEVTLWRPNVARRP